MSWWDTVTDLYEQYVWRRHVHALGIALLLYAAAGTTLFKGCQISRESFGVNATPIPVELADLELGSRPGNRRILTGRYIEVGSAGIEFRAFPYSKNYHGLVPLVADDNDSTREMQTGEQVDDRSIRLYNHLTRRGRNSRVWLWDRSQSTSRFGYPITVRSGLQGLIVGDADVLPEEARQHLSHLPANEVIIIVADQKSSLVKGVLLIIGGLFLAAGAIVMTYPTLRHVADTSS